MYDELIRKLDDYPNLRKCVKHFYETNGQAEHDGYLPNLIVWIRQVLDEVGEDAAERFSMPQEVAEDFWSWGHNSRWANTFWFWLHAHFFGCVEECIELAEDAGDYDVEKYFQQTQKDEK